jgi:outer membrane immunogenic protein
MRVIAVGALAIGAGLLMVGSGLAADLYVPAPELVAMPESTPWSGCYVGLPISWASGETPSTAPLSDYSSPLEGFPLGLQAGCDVKVDSASPLLIGVVTDIFGNGPSGESDPIPVAQGIDAVSASSVPWFGTLRARVGLGTDHTLFYLTGGLAVAQVRNEISTTTFAGETVSNTHLGWTVGAAVEQKLDENWGLFAEYAYYDLGAKDYTYSAPLTVGTLELHPTFHQVKVGVNYHF